MIPNGDNGTSINIETKDCLMISLIALATGHIVGFIFFLLVAAFIEEQENKKSDSDE